MLLMRAEFPSTLLKNSLLLHGIQTMQIPSRLILCVMKKARLAMIFLSVGVAITPFANQTLQAEGRPLLIETHQAVGLKCTQCHLERPPKLTPSTTTCFSCHGDQQALANKTKDAFPNPHASPHLSAGEAQVCSECHHVHRPPEVSCTSCHRDFYFNVK